MPGSGNTSPKDMESLLPLMSMVIYSIDKAKKFRLNREVSGIYFPVFWILYEIATITIGSLIFNMGSFLSLMWLPEILHPAYGEIHMNCISFSLSKG